MHVGTNDYVKSEYELRRTCKQYQVVELELASKVGRMQPLIHRQNGVACVTTARYVNDRIGTYGKAIWG